ncbi:MULTISPECIES: dipeptide ABC transporter ATP-binding protein [Bradyrhizobium]|uniref:ABC transporter ATP-binding protein n=3 Tax=Bradyrhizobium TaxID=374 RepID=A0AAE5X8L8_9BRAD|nr:MULTISPECIES: ABC transporter ATP-binding protein [Bradyrhizobium]MCG2632960.1 ABC transporter ATP-binding protein [Bradyrhizobium zhengyangense]MCG2645732.1 ABC transporter ATP-binding protein [Bradyrhizobium zhengyangense]MCG2673162.1 ABC transporter ATP-binding protein [Bradyrhizobium zhengyangense]MDN4988232.1 ABC transporter ATP-binding protein [Bradyrhizobium sp. WYCCWR 13022]MDN5006314.1 ABC transporter ATP-binding protein [Bradyrhizobium sp. WYCCWR 12677]
MTTTAQPCVLSIRGLSVDFPSRHGALQAVCNVSLDIAPGEILGIVGESGAGKSTVGAAITGLLQAPGHISAGEVRLSGDIIDARDVKAMRALRGKRVSTIFQDPLTSLNPLFTIERQLVDTIRTHLALSRSDARIEAVRQLEAVGIPEPARRVKNWPHEFSGGMRQRAVIALALCSQPELIVADEPTTALDVTVQAQILKLIKNLARERQVGVMLITHNMGVISQVTDRVAVMRAGEIVELNDTAAVLGNPCHEYSQALISVVPRGDIKLHRFPVSGAARNIDAAMQWLLERDMPQSSSQPEALVELRGVERVYGATGMFGGSARRAFKALHDVNLSIRPGEVMGLVGESGSGKSTIARVVAGLARPSSGQLIYGGKDVYAASLEDRQDIRRQTQMVFQDPYSSLNPQMRVGEIIMEPMIHFGLVKDKREAEPIMLELLKAVGLEPTVARRYPHAFSGGQRQRISIARTLASRPRFLICDEPTSALDVSIQAQILNLLKDLQENLSLTMLFISHDLPVVRQICDRVTVLQNGQICESSETEQLFKAPKHSYTASLLSMIPKMQTPEWIVKPSEIPSQSIC